MRKLQYSLAIYLVFVVFLTSNSGFAAERSKIQSLIFRHQREKQRVTKGFKSLTSKSLPISIDPERLRRMGYEIDGLEGESCALYVSKPLSVSDKVDLAEKGIFVSPTFIPPVEGRHAQGFYLAAVRYDSLDEVERDSRIVRLSSTEVLMNYHNDISTTMTKVDVVRLKGAGGRGVRVAVIDSGLDRAHADIPALVEGYNVTTGLTVGQWTTNIANTVTHHGTHVSGTCVGRGTYSGGTYSGAAPEAELCFYKVEDGGGIITNDYLIRAIDRATAVGCKVLSMSIGSSFGPRDGSDPVAQAIDAASAAGVTCFVSAGNEQLDMEHLAVTLAPGASTTITFTLTNPLPVVDIFWEYINFYWRDDTVGDNNIQVTCTNLGATETLTDGTGFTSRDTDYNETELFYELAVGQTKVYSFQLTNTAVGGTPAEIHVFHYPPYNFNQGTLDGHDAEYIVGSPAVADTAIAVGAWTHRSSWLDYTGSGWLYPDTEGQLAPFSSIGPRIDGVMKPDICAPGHATISCLDSMVPADSFMQIDDDGQNLDGSGPAHYLVMSGTSMACPWAAGVGALVIQARPEYTPAQVAAALKESASQASAPDNRVGYGLIDASKAVDTTNLALISEGFYKKLSSGCSFSRQNESKGWLSPLLLLLIFTLLAKLNKHYKKEAR